MGKVLIITYYWPPAGGPGVQRVLKFAKYLPEFGWQPVILTVKNGEYPARDDSLEKEIPSNVKAFRSPIWEPYDLYRKFTGKQKDESIPVAVLAQNKNLTIKTKIIHWIRANLFIPDARIGWKITAPKVAKKIISDESIDLIFISSPPHSLHLIGLNLQKNSSVPYIADFRDPWTDIHYYRNIKRLKLTKLIDRYLEKKVLDNCDRLVTVSPALKRLFQSKSSQLNCDVVFNGYDAEDFHFDEFENEEKNFKLAYIGNFKDNQNVPALWQVFRELINENKEFSNHLKLHFTGKVNHDIIQELKNNNLINFTKLENYVPHNKAIKRMKQASVLLFIIPNAPLNTGILTGKIFDYLGSETPLLSIGPDGDASELLQNVEAGPMFDYTAQKAIKNYLLNLFKLWKKNCLSEKSPDHDKVRNFNRKSQTEKLAHFFDNYVN